VLAASLAVLLVTAGCATAPTYYTWGGYEEIIYAVHAKPGALTNDQQIAQMEADRQAAAAAHGRLPPGWHAQLASLHAQAGNTASARAELLAEKTAFPESAALMDRLLANLAASQPTDGAQAP
jgi:hypothetical protein